MTALAFFVQNWAQRHTTAVRAALIFSLEPVAAALFSHFSAASRSGRDWAGGGLIVAGVAAGEVGERAAGDADGGGACAVARGCARGALALASALRGRRGAVRRASDRAASAATCASRAARCSSTRAGARSARSSPTRTATTSRATTGPSPPRATLALARHRLGDRAKKGEALPVALPRAVRPRRARRSSSSRRATCSARRRSASRKNGVALGYTGDLCTDETLTRRAGRGDALRRARPRVDVRQAALRLPAEARGARATVKRSWTTRSSDGATPVLLGVRARQGAGDPEVPRRRRATAARSTRSSTR